MLKLTIQAPTFTEVLGVKGSFRMPNSKLTLHYFLTIASDQSLPSNKKFLQSLKPLRDYIDISSVSSLDDILQRDVDDARVANGIVQYLLNSNTNSPVFFPSIVVVLQPKPQNGTKETYPLKKPVGANKFQFGDHWTLERHNVGETTTPISTLGINLDLVIPIIIDGQHRTAGFQYVSKNYNFTGANDIYSKFYEAHDDDLPHSFDSDLPVTAVWFEHEDKDPSKIDVRSFARKMFVDINQSSQTIAKSRKLILDDVSPRGFLTRVTYDVLARDAGFSTGQELSLFHAGFDYPRTLGRSSDWMKQAFFIPELMSYALENLLFGPAANDATCINIAKQLKEEKLHSESFDDILGAGSFSANFNVEEDIEENKWFTVNPERIAPLRDRVEANVTEPVLNLISQNKFYRRIIETVSDINTNFKDSTVKTPVIFDQTFTHYIWDKVFCGGEGLYYSIKSSQATSTQMHRTAIRDIDDYYQNHLASKYQDLQPKDVLVLVESTNTAAYFVGYIMASKAYFNFIKLQTTSATFSECTAQLSEYLTEVNWDLVAKFILQLKQRPFLSSIDPKSWPKYRDIHLRYLSELGYYAFNSIINLEDLIFDAAFKEKGKAYAINIGEKWNVIKEDWLTDGINTLINRTEWKQIANDVQSDIEQMMTSCGLTPNFKTLSKFN